MSWEKGKKPVSYFKRRRPSLTFTKQLKHVKNEAESHHGRARPKDLDRLIHNLFRFFCRLFLRHLLNALAGDIRCGGKRLRNKEGRKEKSEERGEKKDKEGGQEGEEEEEEEEGRKERRRREKEKRK